MEFQNKYLHLFGKEGSLKQPQCLTQFMDGQFPIELHTGIPLSIRDTKKYEELMGKGHKNC